jgi:Arc/MetJ family transcription regulator
LVQELSMRATVTLDDDLLKKAQEYTGLSERTSLLRRALTVLIQVEAGRRLIALGGSDPNAEAAPRRRVDDLRD